MQNDNDVFARRIAIIAKHLIAVQELNDGQLPLDDKYEKVMFFVCEIIRVAVGLADQDLAD